MDYQPVSKEEEEYLKNYNPKDYQNPAVTVDGGVFAYDEKDGKMKVLLIKRGNYPYKDCFCLPGGFVNLNEDIKDAIDREIQEETALEEIDFAPVIILGDPGRDPRQHVVTVVYAAYVELEDVNAVAGDDAAEAEWFSIDAYNSEDYAEDENAIRDISMKLTGSVVLTPKIREITKKGVVQKKEVQLLDGGGMGFDHGHEVIAAYEFILDKLVETEE